MRDTGERRGQQRYEEVYAGTYGDLVRFVVRRGYPRDQAEDVVAEAFTVAWRRLGDLPEELDDARAWLFGITRRLLLAQQRANNRGQALSVRIGEQAAVGVQTHEHDDLVATSVDLRNAWEKFYSVGGKIGADVTAVTFHAGGIDVQATLKDGYFAAWWPERKPPSLLERLTQDGPPNPDVTITLRDGSTRDASIQDFDISPM